MRRFIVNVFTFLGLVFTLLLVGGLTLALTYRAPKPSVPEVAVLKLNLGQAFEDRAVDDPFARFRGESKASFLDVIAALERAAKDTRVKGLIADVEGVSMSIAKAQELRDALAKFRASGKFAYAFAESTAGNKDIYLAAGFDQFTIAPMGGVALTGINAERLFLRGTFDKIGIEPEVERRRDYKTAGDDYLFKGFTSAAREMTLSYVGSISTQMIEGIAKGRNLSTDEVRALIDRGPLTTQEGLSAKVIDKIAYPDEVKAEALAKAKGEGKTTAKVMTLGKYLAATKDAKTEGTKVALVTATGVIYAGEGASDTGSSIAGAKFARAITKAVEDPTIKAILLRVDSPGGSAVGSEAVRHALLKAREAGKPVVVSMSGVAGSGGYWIAMSADSIVAEPGTITGSIGVIALKPNVEKLAADWGANFDRILFGANAAIGSIGKPYTPAERERLAASIDEVYNMFKGEVAKGRNMSVEAVEKIAQGRVWSGAQAKDLGLVDVLGGLDVAQAQVREKLKLAADAPLDLVSYPKPLSFAENIAKMLGAGDSEETLAQPAALNLTDLAGSDPVLSRLVRAFAPYWRELRFALSGEPVVLMTMPSDFN